MELVSFPSPESPELLPGGRTLAACVLRAGEKRLVSPHTVSLYSHHSYGSGTVLRLTCADFAFSREISSLLLR